MESLEGPWTFHIGPSMAKITVDCTRQAGVSQFSWDVVPAPQGVLLREWLRPDSHTIPKVHRDSRLTAPGLLTA